MFQAWIFLINLQYSEGEIAKQRQFISTLITIEFYSKEQSLLSLQGNAVLGACAEIKF